MKPKKPPKGGYKHIMLPPPESVPFETYDDLPEPDWDGDPEPSLEYGEDYGTCDAPGCMVMYVPSGTDHCGEEGVCWAHCANPVLHSGMLAKPFVNEAILPESAVSTSAYGGVNPLLIGDALISQAGTLQSDSVAYAAQAVLDGKAQDVFEWSKDLLDKAFAAPTPADRIALFVAGIEAIARSEHGQVVAFSEGRSLAKHMADYGDSECGVCENLKKYSDLALDLLKPIAVEQQAEQQEAKQEIMRVNAGVCVDCGNPSERKYSLEEGKGYMCAKCAGPYLLMDDGAPGDPWTEKED